jgi:pyrophosphatase PpaX
VISKYNNFLFDFDGCLADTLNVWLSSYLKLFDRYKVDISEMEIIRDIFGDWDAPTRFGIRDIDEFNQELLSLVGEGYLEVSLFEAVARTLRSIKEVSRLAIVTSSKKEIVLDVLRRNNIEKLFDVILAKDDVSKHKPDPEIIYKAISLLNSTKENTVIIGDSQNDLLAGNRAEIDSILFFPPENERFYDLPKLLEFKPRYVINKFSEIANL